MEKPIENGQMFISPFSSILWRLSQWALLRCFCFWGEGGRIIRWETEVGGCCSGVSPVVLSSLSAFTMLISFSSTLSFFCLPLPSLPCPCILYKRARGQHRTHIHTRSDPHKLTRQKNTRQRRGEAPFKKRGERGKKTILGLSSHLFFVAFVALSIGEL